MDYSGWYLPYDRPRHPAMFRNSAYPLYNPYQPLFNNPPPEYRPFFYPPETKSMTTHQERIPNDVEFYDPLSDLYKLADQPELDHLLRSKTDSILKEDPFSNNTAVDFGFGPLRSLAEYKIDKTQLWYRDTFNIDDLYLFEAALLSDDLIPDRDKLRLWNQRINWENIAGIDNKREYWSRMPAFEQSRIGISPGGWWAYLLFGIPINSFYGYYRLLVGRGGLLTNRPSAFRKGKIEAHYPLTGEVKSRFPFWRDGGLGLGRSLIAWVDDRPGAHSGATSTEESKQKSGEGKQSADAELVNRRLLAQRKMANLINSIMASTMRMEPTFTPYRSVVPGYQHQVPPCQTGIRNPYPYTGGYPPHVRMGGCNFRNPDPYAQYYAGFLNCGTKPRTRSFTEGSRPFPSQQCHNPSTSGQTSNPTAKSQPSQSRPPKSASNYAARQASSTKKKVKLPEKADPVIKDPPSQCQHLVSTSSSLGQNISTCIPKRAPSTGLPSPPELHVPQKLKELVKLKLSRTRSSN